MEIRSNLEDWEGDRLENELEQYRKSICQTGYTSSACVSHGTLHAVESELMDR
jgi:hypothetical protein